MVFIQTWDYFGTNIIDCLGWLNHASVIWWRSIGMHLNTDAINLINEIISHMNHVFKISSGSSILYDGVLNIVFLRIQNINVFSYHQSFILMCWKIIIDLDLFLYKFIIHIWIIRTHNFNNTFVCIKLIVYCDYLFVWMLICYCTHFTI